MMQKYLFLASSLAIAPLTADPSITYIPNEANAVFSLKTEKSSEVESLMAKIREMEAEALAQKQNFKEMALQLEEHELRESKLQEKLESASRQLTALLSDFEETTKRVCKSEEEAERLKQSLATQRKAFTRVEEANTQLLAKLEEQKNEKSLAISPIAQNDLPVGVRNSFTPFRRVHSVRDGETLPSIASEYYGNSGRWTEIYEANRSAIKDLDKIATGTNLVIP